MDWASDSDLSKQSHHSKSNVSQALPPLKPIVRTKPEESTKSEPKKYPLQTELVIIIYYSFRAMFYQHEAANMVFCCTRALSPIATSPPHHTHHHAHIPPSHHSPHTTPPTPLSRLEQRVKQVRALGECPGQAQAGLGVGGEQVLGQQQLRLGGRDALAHLCGVPVVW